MQRTIARLFSTVESAALRRCVPTHEPVSPLDLRCLQHFLDSFQRFLVITGAGMSTESGIPDYRSRRVGRFERLKTTPMSYSEFMGSGSNRQRYWARHYVAWSRFSQCQPNSGHHALAHWEQYGRVQWLVTQNVDGLHQKAGSARITELHGSVHRVVCMSCKKLSDRNTIEVQIREENPHWVGEAAEILADADAELTHGQVALFNTPMCRHCGGILKPDVVFFGDSVPRRRALFVSDQLEKADALIAFGSSLETYSSFKYILQAAEFEKPVCIVTIGETRGDRYADVKIDGRCGEVLSRLEVDWKKLYER